MNAPTGTVRVNGRDVALEEVPGDERLLDTLRWRLGLKGTKEGCRTGGCGACTVLVDGRTTLSCLALTQEFEGRSVTTVEAVGTTPVGDAVQRAFVAEAGLQCGYCTPGFVVALAGLLDELGPEVAKETLMAELGTNLCRCTGYRSIERAVDRAREELRR